MPLSLTLNYNSLTTGFINYLAANSTTLNADLNSSITTIKDMSVENFVLNARQFPAISVDLKNNEQERTELGNASSARRTVVCEWDIGVHARAYLSYTALRVDLRRMVANIEEAIRKDDTLSGTVNQTDISGVEFGTVIKNEGRYQNNAIIDVETISYLS